jgi:putative solute:sodium symporter small subunit
VVFSQQVPKNPYMSNGITTPDTPDRESIEGTILRSYWRSNLYLMGMLLVVWAAVGLGCGVVWADYLNQWELPGTGYPLGFWFAQQGSILTFVLLILVYAILMNRLDKRHHEERDTLLPKAERGDESYTGEGI